MSEVISGYELATKKALDLLESSLFGIVYLSLMFRSLVIMYIIFVEAYLLSLLVETV